MFEKCYKWWILIICIMFTGCYSDLENTLVFEKDILYLKNNKGKILEVTKDAHSFDYDVTGNLVVYVSKTNGKLYLYDCLNEKIKQLNSPEDYYCNRPMFIDKNTIVYTVMEKPEYGFNWPTDSYPGYLFLTDILNGEKKLLIEQDINIFILKKHKTYYVFGYNEGLILFDSKARKYIKISNEQPAYINNESYVIKDNKLFFKSTSKKDVVVDLDYFAKELEKQ